MKSYLHLRAAVLRTLALSLLLAALALAPFAPVSATPQAETAAGSKLYLPRVYSGTPFASPFGVEIISHLKMGSAAYTRLLELNPSLVRVGGGLRWHELQPVEGGPIRWELLDGFENNLRLLHQAGFPAVVSVKGAPEWAVVPGVRTDGKLTTCAPIRADKYQAFANFMLQLVSRYGGSEFGVHNWELGNEPDFDPDDVVVNSVFGCWGDKEDLEYFGGRQYGDMLKVVGAAVKNADPAARVWVGGLVLPSPNSEILNGHGLPELFFKGVLASGAAPYFDAVSYHWHTSYWNATIDYDLLPADWAALGGGTVGKASYLQNLLAQYGVAKDVYLNETAFGCNADDPRVTWCSPPGPDYFNNQADYLVRSVVRGVGAGVRGFAWYSLEDPGWRNTGLLNLDLSPRPSFNAYRFLSATLTNAAFVSSVDYGPGIQAYRFSKGWRTIDVLWALENQSLTARLPAARLLEAYTRDGSPLAAAPAGSDLEVPVGFSPVYLVRLP